MPHQAEPLTPRAFPNSPNPLYYNLTLINRQNQMAVTKPTSCTEEKVRLGWEYVEGGYQDKEAVPTTQGLAVYLGVCRMTPYNWERQENNPHAEDFRLINDRIQAIQGMKIINGGLTGEYNPAFAGKLVARHGFSERQEIDHTSSDKSMSPVDRITVEVIGSDAAKDSGD